MFWFIQESQTHQSELKTNPKKTTLPSKDLVWPLGLSQLQSQEGHLPAPWEKPPSLLVSPTQSRQPRVWLSRGPVCSSLCLPLAFLQDLVVRVPSAYLSIS